MGLPHQRCCVCVLATKNAKKHEEKKVKQRTKE